MLQRTCLLCLLCLQVYEIERVKPEERAPVSILPVAPVMPGMPGALRCARWAAGPLLCRAAWLSLAAFALPQPPEPAAHELSLTAALRRPPGSAVSTARCRLAPQPHPSQLGRDPARATAPTCRPRGRRVGD